VGAAGVGNQYLLNAHGSTLTVDGDFGPATRGAVVAFPTSKGLTADGIVGPNTRQALVS
jgi:peptidoglycan hydrolase-like protein with peptidoglycan-binding domain